MAHGPGMAYDSDSESESDFDMNLRLSIQLVIKQTVTFSRDIQCQSQPAPWAL